MCSLKAVGHPLPVSAKNRLTSIEAVVIGVSLWALCAPFRLREPLLFKGHDVYQCHHHLTQASRSHKTTSQRARGRNREKSEEKLETRQSERL